MHENADVTVSFEKFVAIRAAMERGDPRPEVLKREKVTATQWRVAQRRWLAVLVNEAKDGRDRYRAQYLRAFAGLLPDALAVGAPEPVAASEAHKVPSQPHPQDVAARAESALLPPWKPLSDVTDVGASVADESALLPFHRGYNPAPDRVADEVEAEAREMVGETAFVAALTDEQLAETDAEPAPSGSIDETAVGVVLNLGASPLPFDQDGQSAAAPPLDDHPEADLSGETSFVAALSDEDLAAALPFVALQPPPAAAPSIELTVEQYASLRVELDWAGPAGRASTLTRYGVPDDEAFVSLKRRWSAHFQRAPHDYGRFRMAYDQFSMWIQQSR